MFYQFLHSKLKTLSTLMILGFCLSLSQYSSLEASGWGKNQEVVMYEGIAFSGAYFDMHGLDFAAIIPSKSVISLQNGEVKFKSEFEDGTGYQIATPLNSNFTPPHTLKEFIKHVQDTNPTYIVHPLNGKDYGALYCVDLIPKDQGDTIFWRLVCTKSRVVRMATNDKNEKRRFYFFESIYINKH